MFQSWGKVLRGHTPMLSIEITRECPLHCPGCYAYGANHLGGDVTLRELSDKRGDELVRGVLGLVDRHKPLQVTLVGGEPMVRHRELSRILPELSERGIYSMVVTSGIIAIPRSGCSCPVHAGCLCGRTARASRCAPVSGHLRTHTSHIEGRRVNIHWTITAPMLARDVYLEEYVRFWSAAARGAHIWVSLYSPQRGEESAERLSAGQRKQIASELPRLHAIYPKLLTPEGYAQALLHPPSSPQECTFSRLSNNYSADLKTHVEPCVFGGDPDCIAMRLLGERGGQLDQRQADPGRLFDRALAPRVDGRRRCVGAATARGFAGMARAGRCCAANSAAAARTRTNFTSVTTRPRCSSVVSTTDFCVYHPEQQFQEPYHEASSRFRACLRSRAGHGCVCAGSESAR